MNRRRLLVLLVSGLVSSLVAAACGRGDRSPPGGRVLRLATTTSVVDSGLLAELAPAFEKASGYRLEVQAVGSGKAIDLLASGGADVAVTHAPEAEARAVGLGRAGVRTAVMRNDLVIVGPPDRLGTVAGAADVREALGAIAASGATFVSRGDGSGTHAREVALWRESGVSPAAPFIVATGAGMGETLARASREKAFALTDRATFAAHRKDKGLGLAILFQGDDELANVYAVLEPPVAGKANREGARAFATFLRSPAGRKHIGGFGVARVGEPLFVPVE